ncbi:hypothetical protein SAMN02927903_01123 [Flavobacterium caeni]|uniref:Uncharacterized protein n=2 Tax=Flavobacterium caeni TaxID=490189 RepID=A0A1G5EP97_9FLAO|nr:hypothetical protein SAMN02927903_01123 [Flavobacterium caeni]
MKTTTTKNQTAKVTILVLFVALLSTVKSFGQTVTSSVVETEVEIVTVSGQEIAGAESTASTLNIVSWFMGSKQTPKATISNEGPVSAKKQMINAGIAPNRLLIKSFGKKAANYQSTIA